MRMSRRAKQMLATADLQTRQLRHVPETFAKALMRMGLVASWTRTDGYLNSRARRIVHYADAQLTDAGLAEARRLKDSMTRER